MNDNLRRHIIRGINNNTSSIDVNHYLTMTALENGLKASLSRSNCEYCVNGDGNWINLPAGTSTVSINTGETLSFRGGCVPDDDYGIGTFTINKSFDLSGNCMSMLAGDDADIYPNFTGSGYDYAFKYLFMSSGVKNVSDDFLPATTLSPGCYAYMFYDSTITKAPKLPAVGSGISWDCYTSMFESCKRLTTPPELPSTTVKEGCYECMFMNCTSLTKAPALPATDLTTAPGCYCSMFNGCTSLVTAPALPATNLGDNYMYGEHYRRMFAGCTSLTAMPNLPATVLSPRCYEGMFAGCANLTSVVDALPVTSLRWESCYESMFENCIGLTTTPDLPATVLSKRCYANMFMGCNLLTQTPVLAAPTLVDGCYINMFKDCINLKRATMLAEDILEYSSTPAVTNWLYNVYATGTFVKYKYATWNRSGVIPTGWTVVNDGEEGGGSGGGSTPSYGSYYVDLNGQWVASPYTINGSTVYQSNSNYNVHNSYATMYINITGYDTFKVYIRSYAESSWDYVMISQPNQSITGSTSTTNTTLVKAHTMGNQQGPDGNNISLYTAVEYTGLNYGTYTITVVYRKDGSQSQNDDRGYVYIPLNVQYYY